MATIQHTNTHKKEGNMSEPNGNDCRQMYAIGFTIALVVLAALIWFAITHFALFVKCVAGILGISFLIFSCLRKHKRRR